MRDVGVNDMNVSDVDGVAAPAAVDGPPGAPEGAARRGRRRPWRAVLPPLAVIALLLVAWQVATSVFRIADWILPSPAAIARAASQDAGRLWVDTAATVQLTVLGFLLGTAVGLLVAAVLHLVPVLRAAVYPLLVISQNVPTIALAPLLVIWFGFGLAPKLIVIVLVCFFPVAVATLDGLARTDPLMLDYLRMAGAGRRQVFTKLEFPHALPAAFSGIKIAATYSVLGAVIAEWIAAEHGVGRYMITQKSSFRTDRMFVAIAIVVVLSLLLLGLVVLAERFLVRWRPARERRR